MTEDKKRTLNQNSALHLLLGQLATELNNSGKYMMEVLRHDAEIAWTPEAAKEYLLRPFIKAMYNKSSTTELTTKELSIATEAMLDHVAKTTGLALEFPSIDSLMRGYKND